jgi:hypothetical protein
MKTPTLVVLALLLFVTHAQSQSYAFKVLVSKGKTEIKSVNTWQALKVGASLKATDEVKISENSYLGLIHVNGKALEVREAGSFKVSDLVSRIPVGTSIMNKYTDFILSSNDEKKGRLSATGAVTRGTPDVIDVYLLSEERGTGQGVVYGDKLGVQWTSGQIKGPFEIIFTTLLGDELARVTATGNQLIVPLNEGGLKNEYEIMVKVVSKENRAKGSADYLIKRLRPADREKFTKVMDEIKNSVAEENALSKYYLAGIYEENLLLNDASTAYQEAIKLAPDVTMYQEAYAEFLKRVGLVK